MSYFDVAALAFALSMDAFAVSVCKGLAMEKATLGKSAIVGCRFGVFQAVMPLIGYFLVFLFTDLVMNIDHYIALVLLCLIGANMIRESFSKDEENVSASLSFTVMLTMALATSIDALAAGVTFIGMPVPQTVVAVMLIGIITFLLSAIGVRIGSVFGTRFKSKAEFVGGLVLIFLGVKIFVEHMGFFGA